MNWLDPYVLALIAAVAALSSGLGVLRGHARRAVAVETMGTVLFLGACLYAPQIGAEAVLLVGIGALGMYLIQVTHGQTRRNGSGLGAS